MTSNQVDSALAAPVDEVGARLVALREDQWFDRKSIRTAPRDLAVALCGFANAEGGTVVVGVHNGAVEGLSRQPSKTNEFRRCALEFISPPIRVAFAEIDCLNDSSASDTLLVVSVEPSERVHELSSGDCFLRVGDTTKKLTFIQRQELHFDKGQSQFDGLPAVGAETADLDDLSLTSYKRQIAEGSDLEDVLRARGLRNRDGELTNAAYLLFAKTPLDLFPEAYIRIIRFLDTERGTGSGLNVDDENDVRVEWAIPWAVQKAADIVESMIPRRRSLSPDGTFEGQPIVPKEAWLEGIVNAAIHRSYSLAGDHIRVEIYPDRVEIESPGRFPGLANPEKPMDISRFARNPRIARVCADLRIGQELGEGIKRIFSEMRRVGLTDPVYRQTAGSVKLILLALPRLDRRLAARLPTRSQDVMDAMRAAGIPMGTGQLAEVLEMSRPTLAQRLKALERENLIRWVGKSPRDPRAVWVLSEDGP